MDILQSPVVRHRWLGHTFQPRHNRDGPCRSPCSSRGGSGWHGGGGQQVLGAVAGQQDEAGLASPGLESVHQVAEYLGHRGQQQHRPRRAAEQRGRGGLKHSRAAAVADYRAATHTHTNAHVRTRTFLAVCDRQGCVQPHQQRPDVVLGVNNVRPAHHLKLSRELRQQRRGVLLVLPV